MHPDNTGYPTAVTSIVCGYNFAFTDQILSACGSLNKIVRTWTVLDWCTGQLIAVDSDGNDNIEILKLKDYNGPFIDGEDLTLSTLIVKVFNILIIIIMKMENLKIRQLIPLY